MKKELLSILRSKEYGVLTLGYTVFNLENYEYITIEDFISIVEELDTWDLIDVELYQKALEDVGLDYSDYDDPEMMWDAFLEAVNK